MQTSTTPLTPQQKTALLLKVVSLAQSQLGVQEIPKYSNAGPQVDAYQAAVGLGSGNPWCMAFAVWCYLKVLAGLGLHLAQTTLTLTGYVEGQVDHCKASGTVIASDQISISAGAVAGGTGHVLPGYLMCEWEASLGRYAHTGVVVTSPDADGVFRTVEGNTNTDGGREGYEVAEQTRNVHDSAGDSHPKYCFIMTC